MGTEGHRVSDFLDELSANEQLAEEWRLADRERREEILKARDYKGNVLQALLKLDRNELKQMIQRDHAGHDVFVYRYIK